MIDFIKSGFRRGIKQVQDNPQLVWTLLTAIVIFFGFLYASNNFLLIARDAQDRLINVRVGSMHDVLKEFAPSYLNQPDKLSEILKSIAQDNETIREFRVVLFQDNERVIISSIDEKEIGTTDKGNDFLYDLASVKMDHSLTIEATLDEERVFKTVRAIVKDENVIGAIYTSQSLSMADKMINQGISSGIIILIIVLILVMTLFFRHAKIIDYTVLYRRLEEINRIKDNFISIATHELRTPLTVVRGYIDLLKSSKKLRPDDQKLLNNIDMHSKRLSLLIDDILSVPKIEQGKMEFSWETFNPEFEIRDVVESLHHSAKEKGLNLTYQIKDSAPILADKNKIRQILINIIGNAVKYTKRGEIKAEVSVQENKVSIRVSDTGVGMSAEEQRGLFQKFYRVRSKETRDVIGTGLGLWITAKLVKSMKGSISVESIKGVGTHFVISFPVAKTNEKG